MNEKRHPVADIELGDIGGYTSRARLIFREESLFHNQEKPGAGRMAGIGFVERRG